MNTHVGENAPLLAPTSRRTSTYAAPGSVRNGVAVTLAAGCVVAVLAVSGQLSPMPTRLEQTRAAGRPEAAMGKAPEGKTLPKRAATGNFFTDTWDNTVTAVESVETASAEAWDESIGAVIPALVIPVEDASAPAPEESYDESYDARDADAPSPGGNYGSDFYPGTAGCETVCEGNDIDESGCAAIGPFCEWGEGKCWSAVGPDPCPTDWLVDDNGADAPGPSPIEERIAQDMEDAEYDMEDADAPEPLGPKGGIEDADAPEPMPKGPMEDAENADAPEAMPKGPMEDADAPEPMGPKGTRSEVADGPMPESLNDMHWDTFDDDAEAPRPMPVKGDAVADAPKPAHADAPKPVHGVAPAPAPADAPKTAPKMEEDDAAESPKPAPKSDVKPPKEDDDAEAPRPMPTRDDDAEAPRSMTMDDMHWDTFDNDTDAPMPMPTPVVDGIKAKKAGSDAPAPAPSNPKQVDLLGELEALDWDTFDNDKKPTHSTPREVERKVEELKKLEADIKQAKKEQSKVKAAVASEKQEEKHLAQTVSTEKKVEKAIRADISHEKHEAKVVETGLKKEEKAIKAEITEEHAEHEADTESEHKSETSKAEAKTVHRESSTKTHAESKTAHTASKTSPSDLHKTGSITKPTPPSIFEDEVFRGDIAAGVSDDVIAEIIRTKMADNNVEGDVENFELKHFDFRVAFTVNVAGSSCPKVDDEVFQQGVKDFIHKARASDAVARFGEDERTPLEKVTERYSKPAFEPSTLLQDDLAGVLKSMHVGSCIDLSDKTHHNSPDSKRHKFEVKIVIPRVDSSTNAGDVTKRVASLFDTDHVKKQLEKIHVTKEREDATDVTVEDIVTHGRIAVVEKAQGKH